MSSSSIEIAYYDGTEPVTKALMALHEEDEDVHPLITYTEKQNYKSIIVDFRRGMVRIIDGKVFNGDILPPVCEKDKTEIEELNAAEKQAVQTHFSKFKHILGKEIESFAQYNSQEFLSISANRILSTVLGRDISHYKVGVSNGRVSHFWSEEISGEVHLCIFVVDDGFKITRDADAENVCYLPGAMMVELKVPLSVIKEKAPITEKHITKALVSSIELFNLLQLNPKFLSLYGYSFDKSCPELEQLKKSLDSFLDKNGSKHPFPNLGDQIREPNFKYNLSEAFELKEIHYFQEEKKPKIDSGLELQYEKNMFSFLSSGPKKEDSNPDFSQVCGPLNR